VKHFTLKRLQSDKDDLEKQYQNLKRQHKNIGEQALMVQGAIKYINQTIEKLTGE